MDLVSVIIPTYNDPEKLLLAIRSVLNQTYKYFEIIIINDGSSVSYESIHDFINDNKDINILLFDKVNEGPGLARQYGLEKAKGKYIQYLDSDDELLPNKLMLQVELLSKNPDVVMTYGLSMINNNPSYIHKGKIERKEVDDLLISTLEVRKWHTSSCLWNYPKGNYWLAFFNGEDVLHDFNVSLNCNRKVIFKNVLVTNINFDDSISHLSNAHKDSSKIERLVKNSVELNLYLYNQLKQVDLVDNKLYAEPLSERIFHSASKLVILGFNKEALELLNLSKKLTNSKLKKIELLTLKIIIGLPIKKKKKIIQFLFDIHRVLNSSTIHQYRYV